MEYVVIQTGGKQYKVSAGDQIEIDRVADASGSISFENILLHVVDQETKIGKPYVEGVSVTGKILEQAKGPKIRVARFTAKSRHRRVIGFRPSITRVQIGKIVVKETSAATQTKEGTKISPQKRNQDKTKKV